MTSASRHNGFSLVELLIVVSIVGVVSSIGIPGLMRARMAGNEASAIGSLRAIDSAQSTYASTCARGGYSPNLADLAKAPIGGAPFISHDLDPTVYPGVNFGVAKSGYDFDVEPDANAAPTTAAGAICVANASQAVSGFFARGEPQKPGSTGQRYFASDSRGTLFQDATQSIANPLIGGNTVQAVQ
jgi:prepilin-type N-terminal cleavage/methylation domain-containing protein